MTFKDDIFFILLTYWITDVLFWANLFRSMISVDESLLRNPAALTVGLSKHPWDKDVFSNASIFIIKALSLIIGYMIALVDSIFIAIWKKFNYFSFQIIRRANFTLHRLLFFFFSNFYKQQFLLLSFFVICIYTFVRKNYILFYFTFRKRTWIYEIHLREEDISIMK